jgi:diguanylate cyclase (GGDEF)-like protein/PAS domain S-box-containing protein
MNDTDIEHSATPEEPPGFLVIAGDGRLADQLAATFERSRVECLRDPSELATALLEWRSADPGGPLVVVGGELPPDAITALLEAESRFRSAFADAPIGLALISTDGRLLRVNRALCEIVGFTESDLVATGLGDLTHPDDADMDAPHIARLLAGEVDSFRIEKRYFNRRGHTIWAGVSVAVARDAAGEPLHLVAAVENISATKIAEAALREANAQLQAIFDHAPAWLTLRALDGRYINANDQLIRSLGTTRQDLIGSHPGSHLDPATAAQLHADDHRVWETREPLTCEIAVAGDTGELHTFHEIRYPVLDDTGEVSAFGSFALDITDRTRSEAARERALGELRVAEERFRNAFEHAPVGMGLADLDGRFVKVNDALCAMLGYRPDELLATTSATITHPEDVDLGREQTEQLLRGEIDHFHREKRLLRAAGEPLWVAAHVSVLRDRDGHPLQFVQQVVDVTERRRLEKELRHLADHDPLTGLLNRRGLEAELERHLTRVNRYGDRGAVLVLDLDHFKTINDTLGHDGGDQLIVSVGEILTARLRETDTVARLGGDEFAILLPEATLTAAEEVASQLVADIHEHAVLSGGQLPRHITASIGVTTFHQGLASGEEALVNADIAMYEAKEAGRGRLAVHTPDRSERPRTEARKAWIERIREALEDDRLTLVAQPVVAIAGGEVAQHELLLRMVQDGGDSIPPGAFLYIAERYDLVQELDRWVAARAIRLLETGWGAGSSVGSTLGLNVSARSLADDELVSLVSRELERSGIEPSQLVFEVTETAAVANIRQTRRFAERLERLGCRFALDDFGAGFGSFFYLKHIPFDFLKIDGELVSGCRANRTDQLVVESLVAIARGLGKQVVAKGVEDADTQAFLRRTGVDFGQGYHFGHPTPVAVPAAAVRIAAVPAAAVPAPAVPARSRR